MAEREMHMEVPFRFDEFHRRWCGSIVDQLRRTDIPKSRITFGRAAKLIAIYLKVVVVLGRQSGTALARIVHPPIDRILLRNLAADDKVMSDYKAKWVRIKWTKLNEREYYELIRQLRQVLGAEEPFWKLERYWTVSSDGEL